MKTVAELLEASEVARITAAEKKMNLGELLNGVSLNGGLLNGELLNGVSLNGELLNGGL